MYSYIFKEALCKRTQNKHPPKGFVTSLATTIVAANTLNGSSDM